MGVTKMKVSEHVLKYFKQRGTKFDSDKDSLELHKLHTLQTYAAPTVNFH